MKLCGQKVYPGATLATRINPHAGTLCDVGRASKSESECVSGKSKRVGKWESKWDSGKVRD